MITLYMKGSAESQDGISYDYIYVSEDVVDSLLAAGWVRSISEINSP